MLNKTKACIKELRNFRNDQMDIPVPGSLAFSIIRSHKLGKFNLHISNLFYSGKFTLVLKTKNGYEYRPILTFGYTVGLYRVNKPTLL